MHRDLKPSNILTNEDCEIAICDFGLARQIKEDPRLTEYVVTRYYRAPEIVLSTKKYNKGVDIWSFGCILYELLEGKPLFPAKNYTKLIELFIKYLGTPSENFLKIINPIKLKLINSFPQSEPKKISQVLNIKYENKLLLNLLDQCLLFDPDLRISSQDALKHPYFEEYFDPNHLKYDEIDIDFDFEIPKISDSKLDLLHLKTLLLKEINEINSKLGEQCYYIKNGTLNILSAQEYEKFKQEIHHLEVDHKISKITKIN